MEEETKEELNEDQTMEGQAMEAQLEADSNEVSQERLREMVMAFIFVALKPITISELCTLTKSSEEDVSTIVNSLVEELNGMQLGIELKTIGESYQLRTKPYLGKVLQRLITPKMKRLSKAAAETLAIIAYKQPVSKAEIEAIRGVDALPTLKTLIDGRLIRIVGREDTPGSPALYGTTEFFLERFGLKDLSELPTVREVRELADEMSEMDTEAEEFMEQDDATEDNENKSEEINLDELVGENQTSH